MKLLCLCPTYGRRPELLNNAIACFVHQTHPDKHLLIYDDLGTLSDCNIDRVDITIVTSSQRSPSVGAKYNEMLDFFAGEFEGVIVWDDDDVYLPKHLSYHNEVLQSYGWSKPSRIISAYHEPPKVEDAAGRFHGAIAARFDLLQKVGGWIDTKRATFDQEMLARLRTYAPSGDPCYIGDPTYIYRWQTSNAGHCSGLMGRDTWYNDYKPDSTAPVESLTPEYDSDTERLLLGVQSKRWGSMLGMQDAPS
jgi:glycosyltransferase involved in cell wall biosynthesis